MSKKHLTILEIVNKLKKKDFTITYKEAIDLKYSLLNIDYKWLGFAGTTESKLMYIELCDFSGVKLHIVEDANAKAD